MLEVIEELSHSLMHVLSIDADMRWADLFIVADDQHLLPDVEEGKSVGATLRGLIDNHDIGTFSKDGVANLAKIFAAEENAPAFPRQVSKQKGLA